jgi:hypothetical protein
MYFSVRAGSLFRVGLYLQKQIFTIGFGFSRVSIDFLVTSYRKKEKRSCLLKLRPSNDILETEHNLTRL